MIIFDEAQTLPVAYLEPCVAAISELVANYGSTAILCTATQPALEGIFEKYLPDLVMREICEDSGNMYEVFRRTCIKDIGTLSLQDLVEGLAGKQQYLCIVNKRKTAQEIYGQIEHEGAYCLTTLLYTAYRKEKIVQIYSRLYQGSGNHPTG